MRVKRRSRWLAPSLLMVAAAVGLLWWQPWRDARPVAALAADPPARWALPGMSPASASGAGRVADTVQASGASQVADDDVEVCGVGRVSRRETDAVPTMQQAAGQHWRQVLDLRQQAALRGIAARLAAGSDAEQVAARLLMGDVDGAALIASSSRDAAAYRLALTACGWGADPASPRCGALSMQGWMQLDPDDARPWLAVASEAIGRRDDATAAEALEQVLRRSKRSPSNPLVGLASAARQSAGDEAGAGLAMIAALGMDFALPDRVPSVGRYCTAESVKEASRRGRCQRLARWQLEHADTAMDAGIALGIADRAGLPAEQRPYTREQLDRGMEKLRQESNDMLAYDCANLQRFGLWVAQRAEAGELQMVLRAASSPG